MMDLEVCGSGASSQPKNTGFIKQCLDEGMISSYLTLEDFEATRAEIVDEAFIKQAIQDKKIAVMFGVDEAPEDTSTEDEYQEGLRGKEKIKDGIPSLKTTHWLGLCSHSAMKSYTDSSFTREIRVLNDGKIRGTIKSNGKYAGIKLSSLNVENRIDPVVGTSTGKTVVERQYEDLTELEDNAFVIQPEYNAKQLKGIFDVTLTADAVNSNAVSVAATLGCGGDNVKTLVLADFVLKDSTGSTKTITSATYNTATNKYDIVGASIVATDTIEINGVVSSGINIYEGIEPVTLV